MMFDLRFIRKGCGVLLLVAASVALWYMILWRGSLPLAEAQSEGEWSEPILISTNPPHSWFPDIAVDGDGRIHVVYDAADVPLGGDMVMPGVMYTVCEDGVWSAPNDLHVGTGLGNIFRPAVGVDWLGNVHMTHSAGGMWYYRARVDSAWSAAAWTPHILDNSATYMSDVAVDSHGAIHAAYEKWVLLDEPITRTYDSEVGGITDLFVTGLTNIFYRRSSDGGRTWSAPLNLSQNKEVGSFRVQIKVDRNDVLHVTWDEGWDRLSAYGEPRESVYIRSTDGGQSWSEPAVFSQPENTNAQIASGSDGRGGVMVVWRATSIDNLFYAWSTDGGQTWPPPDRIPGLYARTYRDTDFDAYDMATDSADRIHLVAVGRLRLPANRTEPVPLGVYHLVWDGVSWSAPDPIAVYTEDEGFPEYPKIVVSEGNKLHVVWFVRDERYRAGEYLHVLYSSGLSAAPHHTPVPVPAPTSTPLPTPTPLPPPTSTPFPTVVPGTSQPPRGLYTENDEVGQLALALSPVILVVMIIAAVRLLKSHV